MGKITALVNHLYQFDFKNRHIVSPLSRTCGMERAGVRFLAASLRPPRITRQHSFCVFCVKPSYTQPISPQ